MDERTELIRELLRSGASLDDAATWVGPMADIGEMVDLLERSPELRLFMRIARSGPMPLSEVQHRWRDDGDRIAEYAWDVYLAEQQARICTVCHIDHDDIRNPDDDRPLADGKYKLQRVDCWTSHQKKRAIKNRISDEDQAEGITYEVAPRSPGDPFIDDRTEAERAEPVE